MTNSVVQPIRANRIPLSAQTQQYLLDLIETGSYQPGEQLPSEKELSVQLGISRPTLREALLNLEQDGIVVRRHGVGTFVAPGYEHRLESGLERLESVLELAAQQGLESEVGDLEIELTPADQDLANRLKVAPSTPLTSVRRTILVDGKPVAYMADFALASILSPADIDESFRGSVLDLLRQKEDLQVAQAMAHIVAINAGRFLTRKLQVGAGQALLMLEETLFDNAGTALDFSRNYFVPDCFQFHVVRR